MAATAARGSVSTAHLGAALRSQFPALRQTVYDGKPLVYLDSAATSQKPQVVIDAVTNYYEHDNANVHRGAHALSIRATNAYEAARDKVAAFVNAASRREIVFTRGATEAINLVAATWGVQNVGAGDEIVISEVEHHANIVPWQLLAQRAGAVVRYARVDGATGGIDVAHFKSLINPRTKMVAFPHVSNVLGWIAPVAELVAAARTVGAHVLIDACQSVPHMPVDVQALGADFVVASGHKMCGPTGIGFLWGRLDVLEGMPPYQSGGEMIDQVSIHGTTFAEPPGRFEAGTPAIAQAVGLGAACDFLTSLGMESVEAHEHELAIYLTERLATVEGLTLYGPPAGSPRAALAAFSLQGVHANDLATFVDQDGVAIRAGHHCTQPLHTALGIGASARASLYLYSTREDVDALIESIRSTQELFKQLS
ncbi:cysteine desulfurase [Pavlovales sp. CCMP2436]|nr:cysteine desulfurase [Pavlovales sp. CCMP2436]